MKRAAAVGLLMMTCGLASAQSTEGLLGIQWLPFARSSFEQAAAQRRPVLVYLRAADCLPCATMEADVLGHQDMANWMRDAGVPVAVDVDERPDVAQRYLMRAVPTLALVLPNGEPMYNIEDVTSLERAGGYFTDPRQLREYLDRAASYMLDRPHEIVNKSLKVAATEAKVRALQPGVPPVEKAQALETRLRDGLDFTHGGYGRAWKRPLAEPMLYLRRAAAGGDVQAGRALLLTAQSMLDSPLHDAVQGGFHHFATTREWGAPALEKRLEVNAEALRILAAAHSIEPREAFVAGMEGVVSFLQATLARPDGSFSFSQHGSLGAHDPGSYFAADAEGRAALRPPPVDGRVFTTANARAGVALLEAGAVLGRAEWEAAAYRTLDAIGASLYTRGRGFARYLDLKGRSQVEGLLVDQAAGLEFLLAAYQHRGAKADLDRALEVYEFAVNNLKRENGYFVDRVRDRFAVGMLRRPLIPLDDNGRMARSAVRLAALTGDRNYAAHAAGVLGALAKRMESLQPVDAPVAEALRGLADPPVAAVVAGTVSAALRRAATLLPVAAAVVVPGREEATRAHLPAGSAAEDGLYLCRGSSCQGPVAGASALQRALEALTSGLPAAPEKAP